MNERLRPHKKEKIEPKKGPWSVEPGSAVDRLEQAQKLEKPDREFEKQTLQAFLTQLQVETEKDGSEYEVEQTDHGLFITEIDHEYLSRFMLHVNNLMDQANELLKVHKKPFRIRFHMRGMGGVALLIDRK